MVYHMTAVWRFRYFLMALVGLDLRKRYTRSVIGVGWTVIQPIVMAGVFVVVFSGVLGLSPAAYVTTLLLNMAVWNFLKESAVGGCEAFTGHEVYIRQSPLPFALYPLRTVLGTAVHSGIAFLVALVAVVTVNGGFDRLALLWAVVPVLALLVAVGWAAATLFSFAQVYFHDTKHLIDIGAQILFFLTPIMYPAQVLVDKQIGWLARINPVNLFMELIRGPLVSGELPDAKLYGYALTFTVALVGLATAAIARFHTRLIFRL